ncbi:MAG: hypothetical protein ABW122_12390 [Ilumatobacteraceae bacterium]
MTDAPAPRFHELAIYTVGAGLLDPLVERFRDHTVRLWDRAGLRCDAFWIERGIGASWSLDPGTPMVPTGDGVQRIFYVVSAADESELDAAWARFRDDEEWQAVVEASNAAAGGRMVVAYQRFRLEPAPFSALQ